MPSDPRVLQARRRAHLIASRRRRAALVVGVVLLGGGGLAIGALGIGSSGGEAASDSAPAAALPPSEPLPSMSDSQFAGQRLIAGFEGTAAPAGLKRMIARGRLAGVILFAGNIGGRSTTSSLISSLQAVPRPDGLDAPLLVMVDQEGGIVKRVDGPPNASAGEMGRRGGAYASGQGAAAARSLDERGFNVDLAPVVDVGRPGSQISREGRSFGVSPERVVETAVDGFAAGLQEGGVIATAKHFPGLGAAAANTDDSAQQVGTSRSRLRRIDEKPFDAFATSGGEMVMLALASYTAFGERPAALSRAIATGELRGRIGFRGVSITDSLDAAA
ncbi:MAG: glycoside hydrolase family 3 N-terminal domain-containing protein, partial [Solirubrobacterales bacterium]